MPNSYFRFKQFTVHQERCAMKVCTDACLFGAWIASKAGTTVKSILDVGTGTGLLSLMIAQQTHADIDAIEIDGQAAAQAADNCSASPWQKRINVVHSALQDFLPGKKYDLVVSNPPFYEHDLSSGDFRRDLALHSSGMTVSNLVSAVAPLINQDGRFVVLLPFHRTAYFEQLAAARGLWLHDQVGVRQTPAHGCFRSMLLFSASKPHRPSATEITIRDAVNSYTEEFAGLLRDYYLSTESNSRIIHPNI